MMSRGKQGRRRVRTGNTVEGGWWDPWSLIFHLSLCLRATFFCCDYTKVLPRKKEMSYKNTVWLRYHQAPHPDHQTTARFENIISRPWSPIFYWMGSQIPSSLLLLLLAPAAVTATSSNITLADNLHCYKHTRRNNACLHNQILNDISFFYKQKKWNSQGTAFKKDDLLKIKKRNKDHS